MCWAPGGRWLSSEQEGELLGGNDSFFLAQDQFSTLNKWNHTVISFPVFQSFFKIMLLSICGCAGLRCCSGFSLVVESRGYSPAALRGLLTVVASPLAEHGL